MCNLLSLPQQVINQISDSYFLKGSLVYRDFIIRFIHGLGCVWFLFSFYVFFSCFVLNYLIILY